MLEQQTVWRCQGAQYLEFTMEISMHLDTQYTTNIRLFSLYQRWFNNTLKIDLTAIMCVQHTLQWQNENKKQLYTYSVIIAKWKGKTINQYKEFSRHLNTIRYFQNRCSSDVLSYVHALMFIDVLFIHPYLICSYGILSPNNNNKFQ